MRRARPARSPWVTEMEDRSRTEVGEVRMLQDREEDRT